jgi:hypothetical protein
MNHLLEERKNRLRVASGTIGEDSRQCNRKIEIYACSIDARAESSCAPERKSRSRLETTHRSSMSDRLVVHLRSRQPGEVEQHRGELPASLSGG